MGELLSFQIFINEPVELLNLSLNAKAVLPEAAVLMAMLGTLLVDLAGEKISARWSPPICYAGLGSALILLAMQWDGEIQESFLGAFIADNLAIAFRGVIVLSTLISLLISWRYADQNGSPIGEFAAILLAATLGAMLLCGSTDLVSVFVSLETLSVASYLLSGYLKRDSRSSEAALKYLLVGSAAAAVFLYGASLLYGISGSTNLKEIGTTLLSAPTPLSALALVFVLSTVAFKIAAVPFHQWTPDVYEGSPTPVVAFLSVGSKAAGFALAIRILVGCFSAFDTQWKLLFTVLAVLSMSLGNVVALAQKSMKRMLAYSSIGQAGFVMIGLVCGTEDGFAAMVLYMAAYLFINVSCFLEQWSSPDFRPKFKIPIWVSLTGAVSTFLLMIQLNLAATLIESDIESTNPSSYASSAFNQVSSSIISVILSNDNLVFLL